VTISNISWPKLRERGGGLIFALGLNALLVLALLTLAPALDPEKVDPRNPVTFEMAASPEPEAEKSPERTEKKKKEEAAAPEKKKVEKPKEPRKPVEKPVETPVEKPIVTLPVQPKMPFLQLDSAQMAAADIGKMPKKDDSQSAGTSGQGNSRVAAGPGEGPGGVQLFEAEWYRRPTPAELGGYMPPNAPAGGWGLVACKTVENFRVENCQALGESPQGSGFARAVRLAAWQFLVRPPRVNGKVMVGSWVRIRIDYSRAPASGGGAGM
jgi:protein TonB